MTDQLTKAELMRWVVGLQEDCPLITKGIEHPPEEAGKSRACAICHNSGKVLQFSKLTMVDEVSGVQIPNVTLETLLPALREARYRYTINEGGMVVTPPTKYWPARAIKSSGDDLYDLLRALKETHDAT